MQHGANIYKYAKDIGCNYDEIVDFSSNINLYQPDIDFKIDKKIITRYADSSYRELKNIIAKNYEIKSSNISLYNGATSAIYHLLSSLKGKKVYLYAPLYGEYEKASLKSKKDIYKINRIEDIDAEISKKSIVIFVNPSTPEGSYYDLDELFLMWKKQKCTIILDESFVEFEGYKSLRKQIMDYKKLYIVQSFTKFYACAGVRVGAIFSHKQNIKKLSSPLWNISSLDVEFLKQRLDDDDFKIKTKELHKIQKNELKTILKESNLFDLLVESDANFILTKSTKAQHIFEHLLQDKILVRDCTSFDFLDNQWLRFAIKDKQSHEKLKKSLSEITFS